HRRLQKTWKGRLRRVPCMSGNAEIRKKTFPPIKRGTRSEGSGASLIALSNDFPHIPSMFANAKTFNALPQHEKSREKNHQGIQ
ncbi:MAG: hypothetical protein KBE54_01090, partial [Bilophila sp.]|nr:hypothetical protein [Bilophila sp.]